MAEQSETDVTRCERSPSERAPVNSARPEGPLAQRYVLEAELGRGGMATVYRALDPASGRVVALKQLSARENPTHARELGALFEREYHMLSQLSHPRVIEVYDYGRTDHGPYYTMELLDGGDLRELSPLPWQQACRIAYDVCSSLALLHSRRFIHRDVSPRNVRCTHAGAAKLIDFGAAVPMGAGAQIVGTPAFVPPEVVARSMLDARADLFSLGATLYFSLTGQVAYPARNFAELSDAWSRRLTAPSQWVAGLPAALDDLVMGLLSLEAALRPRSAFEVMQRLSAIAGIEHNESIDVARAYLAAPVLVGRDAAVSELRGRLKRALRRRGGATLLEAESGAGTSRMLDSCAVEAKLLGLTVLRAHADPAGRAFSAAQQLLEQLSEVAPKTLSSVRRAEPLTAALFEAQSATDPAALPKPKPLHADDIDRAGVQHALTRCFLRASEYLPLAITVDDVHDVDDASVALFAALASAAHKRRLSLVLAANSGCPVRAQQAFSVLTGYCARLELPPLDAAATHSLLGSLFGDAPNLALLSDRIHSVAAGNPGNCMALAEWLVERGFARYEGGGWSLPPQLKPADLPAGESAWLERLALLAPLPLRIAQLQALAVHDALAREDYALLVEDVPAEAVDRALTELIAQRVLTSDGVVYRFAQRGWVAALQAHTATTPLLEQHRALARMYDASNRPRVFAIYHLVFGEREDQAVERVLQMFAADNASAIDARIRAPALPFKTLANMFVRCLDYAERQKLPPRQLSELRQGVVMISVATDDATYWRAAPAWLEQLTRDSGLADWRASQISDPAERLSKALTQAFERFNQTAPDQRGYRPDEAIKLLAYFVAVSLAIAGRSLDHTIMLSLAPLLEPFAVVSPAVHALWQSVLGACESRDNRVVTARGRFQEVYERMAQMSDQDVPGAKMIRAGAAFGVGIVEASLGIKSAERWADALDDDPILRVNAMYLRKVMALEHGDWDAAERFRKKAEILAVQLAAPQLFTVMLPAELNAHVFAGDLRGVQQIADRMAALADDAPGWLPFRQLARAAFARLRGDLAEARSILERQLEESDPHSPNLLGGMLAWSSLAAAYVEVLVELGDDERAVSWGRYALQIMLDTGVENRWSLERALALAEAKHDRDAAVARLNQLIEAQRALGVSGVNLGATYEAQLRVAIGAKDKIAIDAYAELITREYRHGLRAGLGARYERLAEEVQRCGLSSIAHLSELNAGAPGVPKTASQSSWDFVAEQLANSCSATERSQRALRLLCQAFGSDAGHLFQWIDGELQLTASDLAPPSSGLAQAARACLERHSAQDEGDTALVSLPRTDRSMAADWVEAGSVYSFRVLVAGGGVGVGVLALLLRPGTAIQVVPHALVEAVADRLAREGS
jgi:hypothetical protein